MSKIFNHSSRAKDVTIREGDEWKAGFNTSNGHYEYLVMPFELCNAPAVFQAFVNDVLRQYLNIFMFVYLDDILIFSPNKESHVDHSSERFFRNS